RSVGTRGGPAGERPHALDPAGGGGGAGAPPQQPAGGAAGNHPGSPPRHRPPWSAVRSTGRPCPPLGPPPIAPLGNTPVGISTPVVRFSLTRYLRATRCTSAAVTLSIPGRYSSTCR